MLLMHVSISAEVQWPDGMYSLPQAVQGCPTGWSSGWRFQDNENRDNGNFWRPSNLNSFMRFDTGRNYRTYYCTKTSSGNSGFVWPRGSYCIARRGGSCPSGFNWGRIDWDDEDYTNDNSRQGRIPDGVYGRTTRINFCCRSDGNPKEGMLLPTNEAFVLYRFGGTCQRVLGMKYPVQLFVHFDDENGYNGNSCHGRHPDGPCGSNHEIYFCYYGH